MSRKNLILLVVDALLIISIGFWFFSRETVATVTNPKVAVVMPLSIPVGQDIRNGIELAYQQSGSSAELVYYDILEIEGENITDQNENAVQMATADPDVVAMIAAPNSDFAIATLTTTNPANLALISPLATNPSLTKPGYTPGAPGIHYPNGQRNFFRTIPSDEMQGQIAAAWFQQQAYTDVVIVRSENNSYNEGLSGIFETYAEEFGVTVIGHVLFSNDQLGEPESIIEQVQALNPQSIYFPLVASIGQDAVLYGLREALPDVPLMGGDGLTYEFYPPENADLIEGIYASAMPADPTMLDSASEFLAAYEAAYEIPPSAVSMASYDAAMAAFTAVDEAQPITREAVVEALNTVSIEGAFATWSFDERGDMTVPVIGIMTYQDGEWITIDVVR